MYSALWRHLPGPTLLRALWCLLIAAGVVFACFTWAFPWVAARLPVNDPNVGTTSYDVSPVAAASSISRPPPARDWPANQVTGTVRPTGEPAGAVR